MFLGLAALSLSACAKKLSPPKGSKTFVNEVKDNPLAEKLTLEDYRAIEPPSYVQTDSAQAERLTQMQNTMDSLSDVELARSIKNIDLKPLDKNKTPIFSMQDSESIKYFFVTVSFKNADTPDIQFLSNLTTLRNGEEDIQYSSQSTDSPHSYGLSAQCTARTGDKCQTISYIVGQYEKQADQTYKTIAKAPFLYTQRSVYWKSQRAEVRPEESSEVVESLQNIDKDLPVLQRTISMPFGPSSTEVKIPLSNDKQLSIRTPRVTRSEDSEQDDTDANNEQTRKSLPGRVYIESLEADETNGKSQISEDVIGFAELDYTDFLHTQPQSEQDTDPVSISIDLNPDNNEVSESIQISTTSSFQEDEEETNEPRKWRERASDFFSDIREYAQAQWEERKERLQKEKEAREEQQRLREQEEQQNGSRQQEGTEDDSPNEITDENHDATPSPDPIESDETDEDIAKADSLPTDRIERIEDESDQPLLNIFNLDWSDREETQADKHMNRIIELESTPEVQGYLKVLTTNSGNFKICSGKTVNRKAYQCAMGMRSDEDCQGLKMSSSKKSAIAHLETIAAFYPFVKEIFEDQDVPPTLMNIVFNESLPFTTQHGVFPIEVNATESASGPYQLITGTGHNLGRQLLKYSPLYTADKVHIYPLSSKRELDIKDDRRYFYPSTLLASRLVKSINRLFNNRPEYLYQAYHDGEPMAALRLSCDDTVDPDNCVDTNVANKTVGRALSRVNSCIRKTGYNEVRSCFNELEKHYGKRYRKFDPTRTFNNGFKAVLNRNASASQCNVLENTLKYIGLSLISLNPQRYDMPIVPYTFIEDPNDPVIYNPYWK